MAFFKRLWRDRRGNSLVIAGMALPLVVGAAGLGTDTVQWVVWKRELQRAADSAAFAGVYAAAQANANKSPTQAVSDDLNTNNQTKVALLGGYPEVAFPTVAGATNAVRVTLAVRRPLGFSGLFMSSAPTITTSATAALVEEGNYCLVALAPSGSAIEMQGSTNVTMGCGAISNSQDPANAVGVIGNGHTFEAEPVAAVGGITEDINGSDDVRSFQIPMEDPFASLSTDIPAGMQCRNYNHATLTNPDGSKRPGCYNNFNPSAGTVLSPGTYYLNNASISLSGHQSLSGEGVTIIMTGDNPGTITMNGNSWIDLTAPTTGPYANMVLISTTEGSSKINGNNNTNLDGAMYFPNGHVEFTGSTGQSFQCAMVVSYTVSFSGNSTIQNDTSSCTADITVPGRRVRLVA